MNVATGRLFVGNNNLLELLGPNTFALDAATGARIWTAAADGTIAASPVLTPDGKILVGGFDGYLRCYDQATGTPLWTFATRDHIYASPALFADGAIVQPSADGTVYALDTGGAPIWKFDTLDALRSSPAIDGGGNVYLGSGEGRLFVINADGTLRYSMRLVDAARDDLNASPALGPDAIVIAGESGEVFSIPYDYCLRASGRHDARCRLGPGEDLPDGGAHLYFATQFGRILTTPPARVEANQPLAFSLFVREAGDTILAHLDAASLRIETTPPKAIRVEVSGDRKFLTIVPRERYAGPGGGSLSVAIRGDYLVNPDRDGLKFTGGTVGGSFDESFRFDVAPTSTETAFPLPVPSGPGSPSGTWELSRLAAPLPTILPSYNQIGFDSLHYLVGLVESTQPGRAVAWVAGARLAPGENRTVIDPATRTLFPLEVTYDGGLLTMESTGGFSIEFANVRIPFDFFRVASRVDGSGAAIEPGPRRVDAVLGHHVLRAFPAADSASAIRTPTSSKSGAAPSSDPTIAA
ncbi:MAG: PQQ-binding-like beta-propeller repeat protein [Acidobacteriota bacterium]